MPDIAEEQVVAAWQRRISNGGKLTTRDGKHVSIIYPGRTNDDRGADICDAVIAIEDDILKGDIEFHVKTSDWLVHRHHQNSTYNRVVLHVVGWSDIGEVKLEDGGHVCTLALAESPAQFEIEPSGKATHSRSGKPCSKAGLRKETLEVLDKAGRERFWRKSAEFQTVLTHAAAPQCLYRGIMGALGYSKNKVPFMELAERVPLSRLQSFLASALSDKDCLESMQALLLGVAGLLPGQRPTSGADEEFITRLEEKWCSLDCSTTMSFKDWHFFKVRPNNLPTIRIVAMTHLLLRYRDGIFEALLDLFNRTALNAFHEVMGKALVVTATGYWESHFDFGVPRRIEGTAILGSARAAEIVINVILPFMAALGRVSSKRELEEKALIRYQSHAALERNTVERHMIKQLQLEGKPVSSAQRQQGLLHIYHSFCRQGECRQCPLV